jgi:hypothetical protein
MRLFLAILLCFLAFKFIESKELDNCNYLTEKYGKIYNLPNKLLTSIALVESGVKKREFKSWPWTLNVAGKSMYFDSKLETLEYLKSNINQKKSIDVGCMQINTRYHLKNFKDLSHLVEPEENVKYAATYLLRLYKKYKSWNEAVSRYHSSIPKRKKNYLKKVYAYWNDLRQRKIVIKNSHIKRDETDKIKFFREILRKEKI